MSHWTRPSKACTSDQQQEAGAPIEDPNGSIPWITLPAASTHALMDGSVSDAFVRLMTADYDLQTRSIALNWHRGARCHSGAVQQHSMQAVHTVTADWLPACLHLAARAWHAPGLCDKTDST
jgi:hypothetical protein